MKKSLIALSSAAVLGVYGAGYMKTRAAAERFSDEPVRRHPVEPAPASIGPVAVPDAAVRPANAVSSAEPGAAPAPTALPAASSQPSTTQRDTQSVTQGAGASVTEPHVQSAAAPRPAGSTPAAAAAPVAATAPTPAPLAAVAGAALTSLPTAVLAAAAPAPAASPYMDGTYTGWGTCRHGDIQAEVVIANGKIASAKIAQCLTRYSCSWISPLPPQVIQRQSPETDYVSGATQSTNAFYYGVVEALLQAKKK